MGSEGETQLCAFPPMDRIAVMGAVSDIHDREKGIENHNAAPYQQRGSNSTGETAIP